MIRGTFPYQSVLIREKDLLLHAQKTQQNQEDEANHPAKKKLAKDIETIYTRDTTG